MIRKPGKSMSNELPWVDIMAAKDLREYHVSSLSIAHSKAYVRWQVRLDYA